MWLLVPPLFTCWSLLSCDLFTCWSLLSCDLFTYWSLLSCDLFTCDHYYHVTYLHVITIIMWLIYMLITIIMWLIYMLITIIMWLIYMLITIIMWLIYMFITVDNGRYSRCGIAFRTVPSWVYWSYSVAYNLSIKLLLVIFACVLHYWVPVLP